MNEVPIKLEFEKYKFERVNEVPIKQLVFWEGANQ